MHEHIDVKENTSLRPVGASDKTLLITDSIDALHHLGSRTWVRVPKYLRDAEAPLLKIGARLTQLIRPSPRATVPNLVVLSQAVRAYIITEIRWKTFTLAFRISKSFKWRGSFGYPRLSISDL